MATSNFKPAVAFHPGVTLAEKLKEMSMSIKDFSLRTSKSEKEIDAIIKGEDSVSYDMATVIESITNIPANFWMRKQHNYDAYKARSRKEVSGGGLYASRLGSTFHLDK